MTQANESEFRYNEGFSYESFNFPDFVPTFFDEVDEALKAEAAQVCNNDTECMFDYVATGNRDLALETIATEEKGLADQQLSSEYYDPKNTLII